MRNIPVRRVIQVIRRPSLERKHVVFPKDIAAFEIEPFGWRGVNSGWVWQDMGVL